MLRRAAAHLIRRLPAIAASGAERGAHLKDAMRVDLFDFDLPPERIALTPASPRDAARLLVVAPGRRARGPRMSAICRDLLRPGDALVVNDTRVIAARLDGIRVRGEAVAAIEATLIKRLDASRWRALVAPGQEAEGRRAHSLRRDRESRPACSARSTPRSRPRARAARSRSPSPSPAPRSTRRSTRSARCRCRPISPRAARPTRAIAPTIRRMFAASTARSPRRPRACISRPSCWRASRRAGARLHRSPCMSAPAPSCRSRPTTRGDHAMHAEWGRLDAATAAALNAARARGGRIVAVGTTSLRLLESAAGEDGRHRAVRRRDRDLHHAGLSLPRRRRAADQFPSAALDAVHAGRAPSRPRDDEARPTPTRSRADYRFYSYGDACLLMRAGRR